MKMDKRYYILKIGENNYKFTSEGEINFLGPPVSKGVLKTVSLEEITDPVKIGELFQNKCGELPKKDKLGSKL